MISKTVNYLLAENVKNALKIKKLNGTESLSERKALFLNLQNFGRRKFV